MILSAAAGPAPQEGIGCVAVSIGAGTYWRDDECGSAQSGDQDDPSSCVPFPPSETDDEERYKSVESIQRFLEEKLKMNKDMTKSEFQAFLLDRAGILASDALLDSIFAATDEDKNGLIDAAELATFVRDIQPTTKKERIKYIVWACLTYAPMYLAIFNLTASLLAAKTNLRERPRGDLYGNLNHPYWSIAAICDLIGNFGYVILKWEEERLAYENIQAARVRLIKWVHFDLPRFLNKAKRKVSCRSNVDIDDDDDMSDEGITDSIAWGGNSEGNAKRSLNQNQNLMQKVAEGTVDGTKAMAGHLMGTLEKFDPRNIFESVEEQKRMGTEALTSIRSVLFEGEGHASSLKKSSVGHDDGLDLRELRLLLETMGVFLADHALREVFWEVDTDRSHTVSIEELIQYAKERETMVFDEKQNCSLFKYFAILKRCCYTIGFWTAWLFVIGAIFWILLSHATKASNFAIQQFLGLICVFYLSGAIGNMTNLYQSTEVVRWQLDSARMMLRAAAIAVGLSQMEKGRIDSTRHVVTRRFSNESQVSIEEMRKSVQNRIRRDAVSKLRHGAKESVAKSTTASRQRLGQIMKSTKSGMAGNDGTGGSGGMFAVYDAEKLAIAQEEGALALFQIIDVSDDSNVDEKELFDALVSLGVMMPSHVFSSLFKSVDESGDGELQLDEFIDYVSSIQPGQTRKHKFITTLKLMVRQLSFYIVLVQITAGSLQTHAAYHPPTSPPLRARNIWLVGSFGWALGSLYFLARWPRSKGAFFDQLENTRFMIKEAILDECRDYIIREEERLG
eukprot:CAMPEP_0181034708 /NCGR_PEP_ID=MMETSP1070-20121207/7950_1 /TAXON_ID=265543 /ORGANISM="Minutocellus polymorphus, Strain NH13" /LENGTH=791 /DNA_ID=CAMNT_0023112251 /DNA_START=254 /DNA_END=2625 /DNA_ORIENTATION=+